MLILARKKEESLIINGNIEIKILEASDGKVKIGIIAPNDIEVHRKEVYEKILQENKAAAAGGMSLKQLMRDAKQKEKNDESKDQEEVDKKDE